MKRKPVKYYRTRPNPSTNPCAGADRPVIRIVDDNDYEARQDSTSEDIRNEDLYQRQLSQYSM